MLFIALCRVLDMTKVSTPLRVQWQTLLQVSAFSIHNRHKNHTEENTKNLTLLPQIFHPWTTLPPATCQQLHTHTVASTTGIATDPYRHPTNMTQHIITLPPCRSLLGVSPSLPEYNQLSQVPYNG